MKPGDDFIALIAGVCFGIAFAIFVAVVVANG